MLIIQRLGLSMIVATLFVMVATVYIFSDYQRDSREIIAKEQGLDLARLLGGMSWSELIPANSGKGFLDALNRGENNPDFAYGALVDIDGNYATEITRSGVIIPKGSLPTDPADWFGQRILQARDGTANFIESYAPVFENGVHKGFVLLGYHRSELSIGYRQMSFLATLTLPIFLLTPLFYIMLRQEMQPLSQISRNIEKLADQGGLSLFELQPNEKLGDFMTQFSNFIDATQSKIQSLNEQQEGLHMSGKLLAYKNIRIDAILQNLPDAIMVIDEAGEVSYANGKILRMLDIRSDVVLGKKPKEWCHDPQIIPLLTFSDAKSSLQANQDTIQITSEDDNAKSLQFNVYPLFVPTDESRILGRLVVVRNVTESRMMLQRQDEFVSHVAHELKTPLSVMAMYSESLISEGTDNEAYRVEAVNVIRDEVERLSTLINNLLAINQYELGGVVAQRKHVRLHELLEDSFKKISKGRRNKKLKFNLDIPRDMGLAFIDKDLFRIAINNLLTNAVKYSKPSKGKVSLTAVESENYIEISVSDEGYGISEQDQKQIFEKFFRSNAVNIREQTGHGLGLSLARQIILMHHGELSFTSELEKGSKFVIKLEKMPSQILDVAKS